MQPKQMVFKDSAGRRFATSEILKGIAQIFYRPVRSWGVRKSLTGRLDQGIQRLCFCNSCKARSSCSPFGWGAVWGVSGTTSIIPATLVRLGLLHVLAALLGLVPSIFWAKRGVSR